MVFGQIAELTCTKPMDVGKDEYTLRATPKESMLCFG